MNNIFNMFQGSFGMFGGAKKITEYNPLINYDWSTTTISGLRYLKDVGSTPAYNASMYFGRAAYFNGVDQTITVPINTTIQTALKRVNGVVTINETSQTLTNYVISGLGVHKDYYLFTRLLTTAEKESYTNTPELFYAMAQADSTCVLNMPMCETDGYARNMKSYSEYELPYNNTRIGYTTSDYIRPIVAGKTIVNNRLRIYDNSSTTNTPRFLLTTDSLAYNYSVLEIDCYYKIEVKVGVVFEFSDIRLRYGTDGNLNGGVIYDTVNLADLKSHTIIIKSTNINEGGIGVIANSIGATEKTSYFDVDYFIVTKLSGVYPITNYTTSVRDNAKNLQYGLQTCKFVRDGLGVIQTASDYLECDGVGYADTGWIPKLTDIFYVETIIENTIGANYSFLGNALTGGLAIGPSAIDNALFIKIFDVQLHIFSKINPRYHIVTGVSDGKVHLFIDGVFHSSTTVVTTTGSTLPVFLGRLNVGNSNMFTPLRLFKVHTSPQDPLELYNKAVAKGLLS